MANKVKRRDGEAKGQSRIGKQWISYPREMVESPALRVMSRGATLVMHFLEKEHMEHGAAENGRLIAPRRQLQEWGVHRDSVAPAIREFVALGFGEITGRGYAGVGGHGKATRFRLTYVNDKHGVEPTHEWRHIATIEEAERIAEKARSEKNPHAQALGERSARVTRQKKISVPVSGKTGPGCRDRTSNHEVPETGTTRAEVGKTGPLSIISVG